MDQIKSWLKDHDNKLTFTILYVGASLFLSLYISIFWLVFVVFIHGIIEFYSLDKEFYSLDKEFKNKLFSVLWHLKLDVTLVFFALLIGLYFEAILGAVGIGGAARSVSQASTRFLAWQKALRGLLLSLDDAAQVVKGTVKTINKDTSLTKEKQYNKVKNDKLLNYGDVLILFFCFTFIFLIVFSPFIIDISYVEAFNSLKNDLDPFP